MPPLNDFEIQLVPSTENKGDDPTYGYRLSWTMNVTDDDQFNTRVFSKIQYNVSLNETVITVYAKDYRVLLGNLSHAQKYDISVKPNYKDRDDFADTNDIKRKDEISKLPVS